ncbi:MAG: riboflavin synthase subunit alpha [Proteobacteria bacterium]|nr:riboflavin synthase subunit alpha [SAR86 cluster bacterium]MDA0344460.1 riboflavin synthase subunit alpha [Pseudomonadota bacterium]MDA0899700.1 riboflavin synthase subunit alpha [Pseudomonadota bacterium]MDA1056426.1 riboflavin synthase subunit alpha [Pseudomonadota bacterium]
MFAGIVQGTGSVIEINKNNSVLNLNIKVPQPIAKKLTIGDSLAVDGVCLTVTRISDVNVSFDVVNETQNRTIISDYNKNSVINLETSLEFGQQVGGHLVSGHVQALGTIKEVEIDGDTKNILLEIANNYSKYIFEKGYVAINGCSLTIGKVIKNTFYVHLIPETLRATNLDSLIYGDKVNLELDQNTITIVDTTERILSNKI